MTLEEKGEILPPPTLDVYAQMVSAEIQQWKNIIAATHWNLYDRQQVDGADFYVAEDELGHIHLDGSVHLITGEAFKKVLVKNKLAKEFIYGDGEWVTFEIRNEQDAKRTIAIFKLNYERLMGSPLDAITSKVNDLLH